MKRRCECAIPGLGGHVNVVATCSLLPELVALGVGDQTIRIWNLSEGIGAQTMHNGGLIWKSIQSKVTALAWHPTREGILAFGTEERMCWGCGRFEDGYYKSTEVQRSSAPEPCHMVMLDREILLAESRESWWGKRNKFFATPDLKHQFCTVCSVKDVNKLLALSEEQSQECTTEVDTGSITERAEMLPDTTALKVQCMCWSGFPNMLLGVTTMDARISVYDCSEKAEAQALEEDSGDSGLEVANARHRTKATSLECTFCG